MFCIFDDLVQRTHGPDKFGSVRFNTFKHREIGNSLLIRYGMPGGRC